MRAPHNGRIAIDDNLKESTYEYITNFLKAPAHHMGETFVKAGENAVEAAVKPRVLAYNQIGQASSGQGLQKFSELQKISESKLSSTLQKLQKHQEKVKEERLERLKKRAADPEDEEGYLKVEWKAKKTDDKIAKFLKTLYEVLQKKIQEKWETGEIKPSEYILLSRELMFPFVGVMRSEDAEKAKNEYYQTLNEVMNPTDTRQQVQENDMTGLDKLKDDVGQSLAEFRELPVVKEFKKLHENLGLYPPPVVEEFVHNIEEDFRNKVVEMEMIREINNLENS